MLRFNFLTPGGAELNKALKISNYLLLQRAMFKKRSISFKCNGFSQAFRMFLRTYFIKCTFTATPICVVPNVTIQNIRRII